MTLKVETVLSLKADQFKREGKAATKTTDRLGDAARDTGRKATDAARRTDRLSSSARRLGRSSREASQSLGGLGRLATTVFGGGFLAQHIVRTAASFETLRAQMRAVTGDAATAAREFERVQQFAAATPFSVQELVQGYIQLSAVSVEASDDVLTSLGNLAAIFGNFGDLVTAVLSRERETFKRFGIDVRQAGEDLVVSYRDFTTTVENTSPGLVAALQEIADRFFPDGMTQRAATLEGALSNLGDSTDAVADAIGRGGLNAALSDLARDLSETASGASSLAATFGAAAGAAIEVGRAAAPLVGVFAAVRLNTYLAGLAARGASAHFITTSRRLATLAIRGRAASAAMHGVRRALTLLGGPVGVALLAAEAVALFALRSSAAAEAQRDLADATDAATQAMSGQQRTRAEVELDAARADYDRASAAAARGGPAAAGWRSQLPTYQAALDAAAAVAGQRRQLVQALRQIDDEIARLDDEIARRDSTPRHPSDAATPSRDAADRQSLVTQRDSIRRDLRILSDRHSGGGDQHPPLAPASDEPQASGRERELAAYIKQLDSALAAMQNLTEEERALEAISSGRFGAISDAEEQARKAAAESDEAESLQRFADMRSRLAGEQAALAGPYEAALHAAQTWRAEQQRVLDALAAENYAVEGLGDVVEDVYRHKITAAVRDAADAEAAAAERRLRDATDLGSGIERAIADLSDELTDFASLSERAVGNAFRGMEDALVQLVSTGKASFDDLAQSIIADLARIAIRAQITLPLFQSLSSLFSSPDYAALAGVDGGHFGADELHGGGIVGAQRNPYRDVPIALFHGAPYLHGGGIAGLRDDEIPAILQRGEGVFTPEQMRVLGAGHQPTRIEVHISNRGMPKEVQQAAPHIDGEGWVIDVVMDDIARGGPLGRTLSASRA